MTALASPKGARTPGGISALSALGTLISLQQPGRMAAEQTFYLTMIEQVCAQVPQIRGGRIELPEVADLAQLVDWGRVGQLAYNI